MNNVPGLETRIFRTIKQLQAGRLRFSERNFAEVLLSYSWMNFLRLMFEDAQDTFWESQCASDDISEGDDDQVNWANRTSLECEE